MKRDSTCDLVWKMWEEGENLTIIAQAVQRGTHWVCVTIATELRHLNSWREIGRIPRLAEWCAGMEAHAKTIISQGGRCKEIRERARVPAWIASAIWSRDKPRRKSEHTRGGALREIARAKLIACIMAGIKPSAAAKLVGVTHAAARGYYQRYKRMDAAQDRAEVVTTGADMARAVPEAQPVLAQADLTAREARAFAALPGGRTGRRSDGRRAARGRACGGGTARESFR